MKQTSTVVVHLRALAYVEQDVEVEVEWDDDDETEYDLEDKAIEEAMDEALAGYADKWESAEVERDTIEVVTTTTL